MPRFQSTLPRGERQNRAIMVLLSSLVSIHAPARGATTIALAVLLSGSGFNPRSREGSDCRDGPIDYWKRAFQSTLPRGERHKKYSTRLRDAGFNPRSREGSDKHKRPWYHPGEQFQSTLPRGERRPKQRPDSARSQSFNPRSREGSDTPYQV